MQSTLNPKPSDPHDIFVVAPDVVPVVHPDHAFSNPTFDSLSRSSDPLADVRPDASADPSIPPVDTTFRAANVNELQLGGDRPSTIGRVLRGLLGVLLAACIGVAAVAWQSKGDMAKRLAAKWVPQFFLTSSQVDDSKPSEQPNPPAVQTAAAQPAASQSVAPAQTAANQPAAEAVAPAAATPSSDSTQSLQSIVGELAAVKQEVAQLKANQEQMSREVAKASEQNARLQNARPKVSALPPRPATAPVRKPPPSFRPSQTAATILPPAVAPAVPRRVESPPLATTQPPTDPELASVPRPPMPLR